MKEDLTRSSSSGGLTQSGPQVCPAWTGVASLVDGITGLSSHKNEDSEFNSNYDFHIRSADVLITLTEQHNKKKLNVRLM